MTRLLTSACSITHITVSTEQAPQGSIWVIEKLWTDWMENEAHAAYGYKTEGYCVSEVTADALIAEAGIFQGECWALSGQWPMRRKVKLDLLKPSP